MSRRKYTLVYHRYIGHGSYIIDHSKVLASAQELDKHRQDESLHFIIKGWPKITYPNGEVITYGKTKWRD